MKAWAVGRLGDVTELLHTQRRDSLCGACRILSTGEPSVLFSMSTQGQRSWGIVAGKFLKSAASQSPSKNCRRRRRRRKNKLTTTRRRVSRMILASVVNASSRRRRGLVRRNREQ